MPAAPRATTIHLRLPRALALLAVGTLLLSQTGCVYMAAGTALGAGIGVATAERPASGGSGAWRPGAAVSLDFSPARDVAAARPGESDTLRARDVTRVVGRLRSVRGDTSWIAITELRRVSGSPLAFASRNEPVAMVVPDAGVRTQVLARKAAPLQRGLVGGAVGFVLVLLGLVVYCHQEQCLN